MLTAPGYLFDPAGPSPSLAVADVPSVVTATKVVQTIVADGLAVAATVILARRPIQPGPGHRLPFALFYGYGAVVILFVPVTAWVAYLGWPEQSLIRDSIQVLFIAVLPVAVLVMFGLGGFRPTTELEALGAWLGRAEGSRAPIETALGSAVGDPSLTVAYWSDELQTWVGTDGLAPETNYERRRAEHVACFGGVRVARDHLRRHRAAPIPVRSNVPPASSRWRSNASDWPRNCERHAWRSSSHGSAWSERPMPSGAGSAAACTTASKPGCC